MGAVLSAIVSEFETQEQAASYDRWVRAKVPISLTDPRATIPHDEVMARMDAIIETAEIDRQHGQKWLKSQPIRSRDGILVNAIAPKRMSNRMLKISWRPTATDDLAEIIAYIAERSPQAARNIKQRVESAMLPLSEHPYLHRSRDDDGFTPRNIGFGTRLSHASVVGAMDNEPLEHKTSRRCAAAPGVRDTQPGPAHARAAARAVTRAISRHLCESPWGDHMRRGLV